MDHPLGKWFDTVPGCEPRMWWSIIWGLPPTMEQPAGWSTSQVSTNCASPQYAPCIIDTLMQVRCYQLFHDGVFNSDPHGGNFLLLPDGRIGLIGFGELPNGSPGTSLWRPVCCLWPCTYNARTNNASLICAKLVGTSPNMGKRTSKRMSWWSYCNFVGVQCDRWQDTVPVRLCCLKNWMTIMTSSLRQLLWFDLDAVNVGCYHTPQEMNFLNRQESWPATPARPGWISPAGWPGF
jgi:hypothetical protein